MRRSKLSANRVRKILTGMITDPKVCSKMAAAISKDKLRFEGDWANIVAKWCCDYLRKYNTAPNGQIELIYQGWAESTSADSKVISQIEDFLDSLSQEHSAADQNGAADNLLDHAKEYFELGKAKDALKELEECIETRDVEGAYRLFERMTRIQLAESNMSCPFDDHTVWMEVFNEERPKPLFEYPGVLGSLVGHSFVRGTLFAFMGIDKSGKSWYLLDAAFRIIKRRYRVAFFEVGDLGKNEVYERLGQRVLHETIDREVVDWPIGWSKKDPDIPITEKRQKSGVSVSHAMKHARRYTRNRKEMLRVSCHQNSSITVAEISSTLQNWKRESGWVPDAVIIDYADILAPPHGINDKNEQVDVLWKQLRRMSQEHDCLVLTATQTGAQAYRKKRSILSRSDFSGRKTKLAEVNGMLGLNMTAEDEKHNVTRLNWVVRRKGGGSELTQVLVAGCFAAGMPIVLSKYASYAKQQLTVEDEKDEE